MLRLLTLVICVLACYPSPGQLKDTVRSETKEFYISFQEAWPAQYPGSEGGNTACPGLSVGYLFSPVGSYFPSPVLIGTDFTMVDYNYAVKGTMATLPIKTSYESASLNFIIRIKPSVRQKNFSLFADIILGSMILYSHTQVNSTISSGDILEYQDKGFNYGAGVGFIWSNNSRKSLGLTFRLLYMRGKNLTYVLPDSFTIDSTGAMGYMTDTANTSYFAIQLGISTVTIKKILRTP